MKKHFKALEIHKCNFKKNELPLNFAGDMWYVNIKKEIKSC